MKPVHFDWAKMKNVQKIHRLLYTIGLGPLVGRMILLLTTTGRKSGQKRVTPVQYEVIDGNYYIGSARGQEADWFRNIQANPRVEVRVKSKQFHGRAEAVTDPARIADFLEYRLQVHPHMVGQMMKMHGLPRRPSRGQLEELANILALVVIQPVPFSEN
jgi:deazaflavin-dependent oxidoreductase (nitroreductase family)